MPGMQCNGMGYAWNAVLRNGYAWNAVLRNRLRLECTVTEWVTPGMQCNGMGYAWNAV